MRLSHKPDRWQHQLLTTFGQDMVVNCSRQSGKTSFAAIKALARALGWSRRLILVVSPTLRQSTLLLRRVNQFMTYLGINRELIIEENKTTLEFANGSRVVCLPAHPDNIRGYDAVDLIILDEAAFMEDDILEAVMPMTAVSRELGFFGDLLIMSTPHGKMGFFFQAWNGDFDVEGMEFIKIQITADQCPRITESYLARQRKILGPRFEQEFFCSFLEAVEQIFTEEDIDSFLEGGWKDPIGLLTAPEDELVATSDNLRGLEI